MDADKFRKAVYIKSKYICAECGGALWGKEPIELHHIIPKQDGGQYTLDNIIPMHRICHQNSHLRRK